MSKSIELRLKQVRHVQKGDREGSLKTLREIWALKKLKKPKIILEKTPLKQINRFNNLDDLNKIKGIGEETVEDIKAIYDDISELIRKLKSGKRIPLRNDVERKLKKTFSI